MLTQTDVFYDGLQACRWHAMTNRNPLKAPQPVELPEIIGAWDGHTFDNRFWVERLPGDGLRSGHYPKELRPKKEAQ